MTVPSVFEAALIALWIASVSFFRPSPRAPKLRTLKWLGSVKSVINSLSSPRTWVDNPSPVTAAKAGPDLSSSRLDSVLIVNENAGHYTMRYMWRRVKDFLIKYTFIYKVWDYSICDRDPDPGKLFMDDYQDLGKIRQAPNLR